MPVVSTAPPAITHPLAEYPSPCASSTVDSLGGHPSRTTAQRKRTSPKRPTSHCRSQSQRQPMVVQAMATKCAVLVVMLLSGQGQSLDADQPPPDLYHTKEEPDYTRLMETAPWRVARKWATPAAGSSDVPTRVTHGARSFPTTSRREEYGAGARGEDASAVEQASGDRRKLHSLLRRTSRSWRDCRPPRLTKSADSYGQGFSRYRMSRPCRRTRQARWPTLTMQCPRGSA